MFSWKITTRCWIGVALLTAAASGVSSCGKALEGTDVVSASARMAHVNLLLIRIVFDFSSIRKRLKTRMASEAALWPVNITGELPIEGEMEKLRMRKCDLGIKCAGVDQVISLV